MATAGTGRQRADHACVDRLAQRPGCDTDQRRSDCRLRKQQLLTAFPVRHETRGRRMLKDIDGSSYGPSSRIATSRRTRHRGSNSN
jgi:hypothetical protein